eukprot:Em0016g741a
MRQSKTIVTIGNRNPCVAVCNVTMPLARSRLEILQIRKLIQCVRSQDIAQIIKLIQMGIDGLVNYQDPSTGDAPLHVAVTHNYDVVATQLLGLGADPGVQDLEGRTAVMRACEYGHVQALDALATKSINTTVADKEGRTALFHCLHSTSRHARCIGFLLECGADPNTKDSHGLPILYAACERGLDRILEKLLDKGADPNAREPVVGKPAVVVATEGNHIECLKLLMTAGVDLNASYGDQKLCALHRAASLGLFETGISNRAPMEFHIETRCGKWPESLLFVLLKAAAISPTTNTCKQCVDEDKGITDSLTVGGRKVYSMPMIGSCSSAALDGGA